MNENILNAIAPDVKLGADVRLAKFINMYGCEVGAGSRVGAFVEIQKNAKVGQRCKIQSHTFICEGVEIGDESFVGHGVMFINDLDPRAVNSEGLPESAKDWVGRFVRTQVGRRVAIGSNATIMGGISIGDHSLIGAGSVVTKDVPANEVWAGNPAKFMRKRNG